MFLFVVTEYVPRRFEFLDLVFFVVRFFESFRVARMKWSERESRNSDDCVHKFIPAVIFQLTPRPDLTGVGHVRPWNAHAW